MPNYKRSDYGSNPHSGRARNNAEARGWGTGWPKCQSSKMKSIRFEGITVVVREEIAELVATLLEVTDDVLGYNIRGNSAEEWNTGAYACRAIRGTQVASNHSWGLAVDVNASRNPMGTRFRSDIPPAVVTVWERCGFYWGGRYTKRPDAMHFEYVFKPDDVAGHLNRARSYLKHEPEKPKEPEKQPEPEQKYEEYRKNVNAGERTVKLSSAGDDVNELQRILNAWYPDLDKLERDGYFGPNTESRVKFLQERANIKVDGIVGPQTWGTLGVRERDEDPPAQGYEPPPFPEGIGPNRRSPSAIPLQQALKAAGYMPKSAAENPNYGPKTQAAVAKFHNANQQFRTRSYDIQIGPRGWAHLHQEAYG